MFGRSGSPTGKLHSVNVTWTVRTCLAVLACGIFSACGSTVRDEDATPWADCVAQYEAVASAPTWGALKAAMLGYEVEGLVASLRTQGRGQKARAGYRHPVRVVDLLDRSGGRVVQVGVWRTKTGGWRAGVWHMCE